MRKVAAGALGQLGSTAATPEVLERLVALTADADREVRWEVARALGRLGSAAAMPVVLKCLEQFWRKHLANFEEQSMGAQYRRSCDIAYEQLQQLAAWRVFSHSQNTHVASQS
jgi:hypothetical protein